MGLLAAAAPLEPAAASELRRLGAKMEGCPMREEQQQMTERPLTARERPRRAAGMAAMAVAEAPWL